MALKPYSSTFKGEVGSGSNAKRGSSFEGLAFLWAMTGGWVGGGGCSGGVVGGSGSGEVDPGPEIERRAARNKIQGMVDTVQQLVMLDAEEEANDQPITAMFRANKANNT